MEFLEQYGDVHLVVPLHEQSWTGKSMTRFDAVHAHPITLWGRSGWAVAGTPADCVNIGVYNLLPKKPDLIVSGINAGLNSGISFLLSSGTVGACLEANIAEIPALALSQDFDFSTRSRYISDYSIEEGTLSGFEGRYRKFLPQIMKSLLDLGDEFRSTPLTWNVNFPCVESDKSALKLCRLSHTRYRRCFEEDKAGLKGDERTFHHRASEISLDPDTGADSALIKQGVTTITPIDITGIGQLGSDLGLVERLGRSLNSKPGNAGF